MKFRCGNTEEQEGALCLRMMNWHDHFAWWPVKVSPGDCRWLETVERKFGYYSGHGDFCNVEYRVPHFKGLLP